MTSSASTQTLPPPPPPPPGPPPRRRLERPHEGRLIGGVCAGLGRYLDIDPVIMRVVLGVLTLFGGAGVALYGLGWLLLPDEGAPRSAGEDVLRGQRGGRVLRAAVAALLVLLVAGILANWLGHGLWLAVVVLAAFAGYLVVRGEQRPRSPVGAGGQPPYPPGSGQPMYPPPSGQPPFPPAAAPYDAGAPTTVLRPAPAARRPRPRSRLGLVTVSLAALVAGGLTAAGVYGAASIPATAVLAAALGVVALGLIVGTWLGRARSLIVVGLALSLALAGAAAAQASVGARSYRPASAADLRGNYRLSVGTLRLDLSQLTAADPRHVDAHVGVGRLVIEVPSGVAVRVHGFAGVGAVTMYGRANGAGFGPNRTTGPTDAALDIDASVGAGQVEVDRG